MRLEASNKWTEIVAKAKKKTKRSRKKESKQRVANRHLIYNFFALLVITLLMYLGYCALTLPDINEAVARTRQPSTTLIAENGNEIKSFGSVYSEVVHQDEMPKYVTEAIISTEDRRFYDHFGFDPISFGRAMLANLFAGRYVQGGSTITQQVAKNLFLTPNKNLKRKTQELMLAFWLEHKFSKEQILTLYLNRVYLGAGTYGIEAASQKYFQKSSRDLNLLEAAIIAGMLKAPSRYNPRASEERAVARAKVVLQNMVDNRCISKDEKEKALKMRIGPEKPSRVEKANYFADWVYNEVNAYIGERDNDIYVATTLDQHIQEAAYRILSETLKANRNKNVTQGAVIVMDRTGAVKAMVGGIDYQHSQFNRATQALRQPGSAFKPFVYLTALQQGWRPNDKIIDGPLEINGWKPANADKKYHGEVTLKYALTHSLNLATINLSEQISRGKIISNARKMGITTPLDNSPALALGSSEVKIIDLATAYTTIANGGRVVWPYGIREVYTRDGYQLYQRGIDYDNQAVAEEDIETLSKMLEKVISDGTGKKARLPFFAAGKTGTSQDNRDAWFAGYSDAYTVVVWLGNDNNSPMKGVSGANLPAEIWKKIMLAAKE